MDLQRYLLAVLALCLAVFTMTLPAQASTVPAEFSFESFFQAYAIESESRLKASLLLQQTLGTSAQNQDVYGGSFTLNPKVAHETRSFQSAQTASIYNRSTDISGSYKQNLPSGTSLEVRGQKFIERSNPLFSAIDSDINLRLQQSLYKNAFGKDQRRRQELGHLQKEVAFKEFRLAELAVCDEAFQLYLDAYIQQQRWLVLKDQLVDAKKAFQTSRRLYRQKLSHRIDTLSSESDYLRLTNQVTQAQRLLQNGINQLATYLPTSPELTTSFASPETGLPKTSDLQKSPTQNFLAVEVAAQKVQMSQMEADSQSNQSLPDLSLGVTLGARDGRFNGPAGFLPFDEEYIQANLRLQWPTFQRSQNAKLRLALKSRNNAELQRARLLETLNVQSLNLLESTGVFTEQLKNSNKRLELLQKKAKLAARQLQAGSMEFETFLLHKNALRTQQLSHLDHLKNSWLNQFQHLRLQSTMQTPFCRVRKANS